jgi:hypothetical protein
MSLIPPCTPRAGKSSERNPSPHSTSSSQVLVAARLAFAFGVVVAFAVGSLGPFLAFNWPSPLRQMLLGYLVAFLITRIAVVVGDFLLAPDAERFRRLVRSLARREASCVPVVPTPASHARHENAEHGRQRFVEMGSKQQRQQLRLVSYFRDRHDAGRGEKRVHEAPSGPARRLSLWHRIPSPGPGRRHRAKGLAKQAAICLPIAPCLGKRQVC